MARDGGVLVVTLVERPAIESIEIDGNKAIPTEALLDGLGQQGLREGEIFKQATLERVGWSSSGSTSARVATVPPSTPTWKSCRGTG